MSTVAYAALTSKRDDATPGSSRTTGSPGVGTFVDAFAALVPSEVLSAHAIILTFTTKTTGVSGKATVTVEATDALVLAFFGLIALSIALYVAPRVRNGHWDKWDYGRMLVPPLAFVGWTMLQKATAFDAVAPQMMTEAMRDVVGVLGAILLGMAASAMAGKADQRTPPRATQATK